MTTSSAPSLTKTVTTRRNFMKAGAAALASLTCVPRNVWAASAEKEPPVTLRCAVMSDIHFYGQSDAEEVRRFRRAIASAYAYADAQSYDKLDAVMVVGDMTDNGNAKQLDLFMKTVGETFRAETKLLPCMGNHEFWPGPKELWEEKTGASSNARYEVNGYQFIATSPEKGTMKAGDYLYVVDWLDKELAAATADDPRKPIFVFQHYPVSETIYGSRGDDNCGVPDLYDTLCKYPNVINFSGHSHYLMSDPRIVWQGGFTAFGTSTISYIFQESFGGKYEAYPIDRYEYSEYYIMEVHADNSVTLAPYDNMKGSFYDFVYRVGAPGSDAPRPYTDERYTTAEAPYWEAGAALRLLGAAETSVRVEIPKAVCRDVVHSYRMDVERLADGAWVEEPPQYFWSRYYDHPMPESVEAVVEGLEPKTSYRVKATALNPFMRPSENPLLLEFTTAEDPDHVDRRAHEPAANFLDVRVVDGKIVNIPVCADGTAKTADVVGDLKVVHDDELDADVILCDGGENYVTIPCGDDDFQRLRRPTIRAKIWIDGSKTSGTASCFACTQGRGMGLNVNYAERTVGFIASIGGSYYRTASTKIETDRWLDIVGVYDGLHQILYVDGKEAARVTLRGFFSYTTDPTAKAICVGADVAHGGKGESFFAGKIAEACIYSWPLTPDQFR